MKKKDVKIKEFKKRVKLVTKEVNALLKLATQLDYSGITIKVKKGKITTHYDIYAGF